MLVVPVADIGAHGLADRSLRDLALAAGSSHRMIIYHFGSRAGLVAALVETVESRLGVQPNTVDLRLGVAVTRGWLIDVLATGDAGPATLAIERFVAMWSV